VESRCCSGLHRLHQGRSWSCEVIEITLRESYGPLSEPIELGRKRLVTLNGEQVNLKASDMLACGLCSLRHGRSGSLRPKEHATAGSRKRHQQPKEERGESSRDKFPIPNGCRAQLLVSRM
jgi:hypothetical protein